MRLTLQLVNPNTDTFCTGRYSAEENAPLSLGRSETCDLVLHDSSLQISSLHATLFYQGGDYYLSDTSTNGTFLNHADERLPRGTSAKLNDGDQIAVGQYIFRVAISPGQAPLAPNQPSTAASQQPDFASQNALPPGQPILGNESASSSPDSLAELMNVGGNKGTPPLVSPPTPAPLSSGADESAPQSHAAPVYDDWLADDDPFGSQDANPAETSVEFPVSPPPPVSGPEPVVAPSVGTGLDQIVEPDTTAPEQHAPPQPQPQPQYQEVSSPAMAANSDAIWTAFLSGLGANGEAFHAGNAACLGSVLQELLSGLTELVRLREKIKNEYRLKRTEIQAENNNPFKFINTPEQLLQAIAGQQSDAFKFGPEAVKEVIADIVAHELSVMAAMQQTVESMMGQVSPEKVIELTQSENKAVLSRLNMKSKYWDNYEKLYGVLFDESSGELLQKINMRFIRHYEEELSKIRGR